MSTANQPDLNEFSSFLQRLLSRGGGKNALRDSKKIQSLAEFTIDSQNALMMTQILAKNDIYSLYLDQSYSDADKQAVSKLHEELFLPEDMVKPYLDVIKEVLGEESVSSEKTAETPVESSWAERNGIYLLPMPTYHDEEHMTEDEKVLREADQYSYGIGVVQDYRRAALLYKKAARMGNHKAMFMVLMFDESIGEDCRYGLDMLQIKSESYRKILQIDLPGEEAAAELIKIAEEGLPEAQFACGNGVSTDIYEYFGNFIDSAKDNHWWIDAAKQGLPEAMLLLGDNFCGERDFDQAFKWWKKAAMKGYPEGEFELGCAYFEGYGVQKDPVEGEKWLRKAARQGDQSAQDELEKRGLKKETVISLLDAPEVTPAIADRLINDYPVDVNKISDVKTTRKYLQKAADAGFAQAQIRMADTYAKTSNKRIEWLEKAAEQGNWEAYEGLAYVYFCKHNHKKYVEWTKQGAESGDPIAQYNLGESLYDSPSEAKKWYELSAKQGYQLAIDKLKKMESDK